MRQFMRHPEARRWSAGRRISHGVTTHAIPPHALKNGGAQDGAIELEIGRNSESSHYQNADRRRQASLRHLHRIALLHGLVAHGSGTFQLVPGEALALDGAFERL